MRRQQDADLVEISRAVRRPGNEMIQCSLWQVPAQIDRQGRMDDQFNRENKTSAATITTAPEVNRKPLVSPRNFCNFSGELSLMTSTPELAQTK